MGGEIQLKEERLIQLKTAKDRVGAPTSRPKIQRVDHYLRHQKHLKKYYSPKFVSFGPIHHGAENLKPGEQYKLMWADMYIERIGQTPQTLHKKIADNIEELKVLFAEDAIRGFDDLEELSWMLFVDGCSLLQIIKKTDSFSPKEMNVKLEQLALVLDDALLLENQLPYEVLKQLSRDQNEDMLMQSMRRFCAFISTLGDRHTVRVIQQVPVPPAHLLDFLRGIMAYGRKAWKENNKSLNDQDLDAIDEPLTSKNIQKLKEAGIRVKKSESGDLGDISFSSSLFSAKLCLPNAISNNFMASVFLNLTAYERCPDFENDYTISAFMAFLALLIAEPGDVKELRSEGILPSSLGSDEEVAMLFKTLNGYLVADWENFPYLLIIFEMYKLFERHYRRHKIRIWITDAYITHLRSPWTILALLAATLVIVLTFIQAWHAIHPKTK